MIDMENRSKTIEEFALFALQNVTMDSVFDFSVFSESSFVYSLDHNDGTTSEISIIAEDCDFFNRESLMDLLNKRNIKYLSFSNHELRTKRIDFNDWRLSESELIKIVNPINN